MKRLDLRHASHLAHGREACPGDYAVRVATLSGSDRLTVLIVSLGVGATTAIFSLIDGVLLNAT
jgi:hypothetical protein